MDAKYIIISEKPIVLRKNEDCLTLTPQEFISSNALKQKKKNPPRVINLCNQYSYLSKGYYVSLLAEARGFPCLPSVSNIITLNWRRNYEFALPELSALLWKHFDEPIEEPLTRTYTTYFGRHTNVKLEAVTRRLFDLFRFPIISFDIKYSQNGKWMIDKIDTQSFTQLPSISREQFDEGLSTFTGSAWKSEAKRKQERYWIAILHDPEEQYAPSNKAALKKFISVGKKMGIWIELITKQDFSSMLEYDAVLIRETTSINGHTYRFAHKAAQEDIPCIDDTESIIRCCNKVYLNELLDVHNIPTPRTLILDKKNLHAKEAEVSYPAVLKIPDGSFSRGIEKAVNAADFFVKAKNMLKKSEIILCQEFLESEFDWRIGVLDNKPIFAIKYFMAKGHWQIYNHNSKNKTNICGEFEAVDVQAIPESVSSIAIKATEKIGTGLYGVDLKETRDKRVVVIEVNDNPNIDHGVEDKLAGDGLYQTVLEHLVKMIES